MGRLLKEADADALKREGGDGDPVLNARGALREGDDGQVVHRDDEGGQRKEQRSAPLRRPDVPDAHVPREEKEHGKAGDARDAQPQRLRDVLAAREQVSQPLRGEQGEPRHQQK